MYPVGDMPQSIAIGDLNGDGVLDVATVNSGALRAWWGMDNTVSVLLGHGDGTFASAVAYRAGPSPFSVAIGDINGDGVMDLSTANPGDNTASVLLGKGNDTFAGALASGVGLLLLHRLTMATSMGTVPWTLPRPTRGCTRMARLALHCERPVQLEGA
jgi:FG-GAP-like repeat